MNDYNVLVVKVRDPEKGEEMELARIRPVEFVIMKYLAVEALRVRLKPGLEVSFSLSDDYGQNAYVVETVPEYAEDEE